MGASGWDYYVPYQPDINKALQDLRQKVFEQGDYYEPWKFLAKTENKNPGFTDRILATLPDPAAKNEFLAAFKKPEKEPETIEELFELNGSEGTHSIIDIERASLEPLREEAEVDYGVIYPCPQEKMLELFGTLRPTREMVEASEEKDPGYFANLVTRWQGIYVTFYKDDKPDGYFFSGYSGD